MNSPEKDIISYDRIRNREKLGSAKYWILGALIRGSGLCGVLSIPDARFAHASGIP